MQGYTFIKGRCRNSTGRFAKTIKCKGGKKEGYYLDGIHCRDSQGAFVPVRQCRKKKRRRKSS